jgi:hypothetical protein
VVVADVTPGVRPERPESAAWYGAPISQFLSASDAEVLGSLLARSQHETNLDQRDAWQREIDILRTALAGMDGWIGLEFSVPRLGTRIDAVLATGRAIVPIEFKVGEDSFNRVDYEQVWDYGLDLKNFHEASHETDIFPVLVATEASGLDVAWDDAHPDGVRPPRRCGASGLAIVLQEAIVLARVGVRDGDGWSRAPYRPTPTIIEAARALYARHSVDAISRNDAGARNLRVTSQFVEDVVDEMSRLGGKAVLFVTGVPGAGKTLVGLNVATRRSGEGNTHAVYLSGNGPLVAVLREALVRDELRRRRDAGEKSRRGVVEQRVKPFIQNVHHFRDDGLRDERRPPADHVVIFDESQRAWNRQKTSEFMRRRKGRAAFDQSEPEFLLSYMDRHADWAVVVCLVGGGQEIHTGEAGIAAWLDAIRERFRHWHVYVSPRLVESEYAASASIAALGRQVRYETDLHLATSMRAFRAEQVSDFVKAVLDGEVLVARGLLTEFISRYPIALTRDLDVARRWIRRHARGSERYGLAASSQAMRLKPHAIDVRVSVDPVHYFLGDATDTRSSYYLEDAATEFQIQGLELDWVCVSWDADLRRAPQGWGFHSFRGAAWTTRRKLEHQRYLLNAYRVLLTRARQGMVIFVPQGSREDPTRHADYYDRTFEYLAGVGIPVIA